MVTSSLLGNYAKPPALLSGVECGRARPPWSALSDSRAVRDLGSAQPPSSPRPRAEGLRQPRVRPSPEPRPPSGPGPTSEATPREPVLFSMPLVHPHRLQPVGTVVARCARGACSSQLVTGPRVPPLLGKAFPGLSSRHLQYLPLNDALRGGLPKERQPSPRQPSPRTTCFSPLFPPVHLSQADLPTVSQCPGPPPQDQSASELVAVICTLV